MGWDSTMSSDYKNNDRIFDIEICGNHYKTSSSNIVFKLSVSEVDPPSLNSCVDSLIIEDSILESFLLLVLLLYNSI